MIDNKQYSRNIVSKEEHLFQRLNSIYTQVLLYEDRRKSQARGLIPVDKLETDALKKLNVVDTPALTPTTEELSFGASRVEGYRCLQCHSSVRFPRYNDPAKLLLTRRGRCGEWANCFTLCALALDFDARYIMDWTDHVWTEVWSEANQRWLHCDPCENVCDKPLLYEKGWNKKLSYVFAFSGDHIMDVTWRYTGNFRETLERRMEARESRLVDFLHRFNQRLLQRLSPERRAVLTKQSVSELVELLAEKKTMSSGEDEGRSSGSLEWRLARGEEGRKGSPSQVHQPTILRPNTAELAGNRFTLTYNCAKDEYCRPVGKERIPDWKSSTFSASNIFRKEEFDWKQVYLARREEAETGEISWKVDTRSLTIRSLTVVLNFKTFESGIVRASCCFGNQCIILKNGKNAILEGFEEADDVTVSMSLSGGRGDCAWQHAQLFRESLQGDTQNSLNIDISFQ